MSAPAPTALQAQDDSVHRRIEAVLGAAAPYEHAFKSLQAAVERGDAAAVAALVHYPIVVRIGGKPVTLRSPGELQRRYAEVFSPAIAAAVTTQKYDALFVNAQGPMFGSDQVWMNGVCPDRACREVQVKVVAIQDGAARWSGAAPAATRCAPSAAGRRPAAACCGTRR